ncbi:hypothetical protein B0H19DRAFT_1254114 [Mycena capillaripes]|nr:hypothetical protein B0H19DRAFT_1254114 [Mycena capillaripes]
MFYVISPELITVLRGLPRLTFLAIDTHPSQRPTPEQETALLDAMTTSGNSHDLLSQSHVFGDIFFTMAHSRNPV